MQTNELREKYLAFFETKGCVRKPSDVLVPRWDPSVLFTPAGMNQFKDHFLGRCKLEFTRATTCQKCLRTGDIDNVGRTAYHHTFFEMLGNFSFGDYFKREAILWAWEFLTGKKWLGLDPARLSATVYKDDAEAATIWTEEVGLPGTRVRFMDEDENFWPAGAPSLGPDGVCGPCSEIYYMTPQGEVEIWNLVFTQFNRVGDPPDNLRPLPSKNIDTGMGLERTAAVLQGVDTNYHIDILRPIVEATGAILGIDYNPGDDNGRRLRRITDHVRACTFAVHENVYPGNKEEKYVIRRLLRRAVLDGRQMGAKEAFLYRLVPTVAAMMRVPYPELSETIERVQQVIRGEEEHFIGTIDHGLERINRLFAGMKAENRRQVDGNEIFEMYQTFGFPPELFETLASEQGCTFDWNGFKREMERHGELSGSAEKNLLFKSDPLEPVKKEHAGTDFLGYDTCWAGNLNVLAIVVDGRLVDRIDQPGTKADIVLDSTPFYGEKGGQVGDSGRLVSEVNHTLFTVETAGWDGNFILHGGTLRSGGIAVGSKLDAAVDERRRTAIRRAHSATHLLHNALRQRLGSHAEQQGSKVDADMLRFDFTHPKAVDREALMLIERDVNTQILAAEDIGCSEMEINEARKYGAMMLFGEKYPEHVRVVTMGDSKELCGGTHLTNTAQIGVFKIVSESSVAAGTRRIEAITGHRAVDRLLRSDAMLSATAQTLKVAPDDVPVRVEAMLAELKKTKKAAETLPRQDRISMEAILASAVTVGHSSVIVQSFSGLNPNDGRSLIDTLRHKFESVAVFLVSEQAEDKVMLLAGLSRNLVADKISAVDWVNAVAVIVGGKGGGRPDMAQAGGKDVKKIPEVLEAARSWAETRLR